MSNRGYEVRTMGSMWSDNSEYGPDMIHGAMGLLGELDPAGSEGGVSNTDLGAGVGVAHADAIPSIDPSTGTSTTLPGFFVDEAKREAAIAAAAAAKLLALARGGGGTPRQHTPLGTRGGGGLGPSGNVGGGGGLFGDLFGAHTDTIVIAGGLVVLGAIAWMALKHHAAPAPRARARRRAA